LERTKNFVVGGAARKKDVRKENKKVPAESSAGSKKGFV
jgi:hypothetical protein